MNYFQRAKFFRTKKRLGQNFLTDGVVIEKIISEADIKPDDIVVEIGAGVGFVTEQLVKHAKKVYAIELDEEAIEELKKINADNLEIVHRDVLKTDFSAFGCDFSNGKWKMENGKLEQKKACRVGILAHHNDKVKIIANIPYYITSPILAHLLGEIDDLDNKNRAHIDSIILMVQWEVAQRILANEKSPAKQFGHLSILAQFFADIELVQKVSRKAFYPSPKVDSALLKFVIRNVPIVEVSDYKFLRKVTKAAFLTRRKNIKNSLVNAGFAKNAVIDTLNKLCINENMRGEALSIQQLAELSTELKNNL